MSGLFIPQPLVRFNPICIFLDKSLPACNKFSRYFGVKMLNMPKEKYQTKTSGRILWLKEIL